MKPSWRRGILSFACFAMTLACMLVKASVHAQAFHLTFDDEFNSLSIANENTYGDSGPTKAGRFEAWYRSHPPRHLLTGEQEEFVDPSFSGFPQEAAAPLGLNPFELHDGVVSLVGNPAPPQDYAYLGDQKYTSGMLTTYSSFSQKCGYFECRAKLPAGQGMWPAFWMLPTTLLEPSGDLKWQYEIDIFECFGSVTNAGGGPNQVHWALHSGNKGAGDWATIPGDIWTGFHTYGVDWEPYPGNITFYVDGQKISSAPTNQNMDTPMFMIACLTFGGTWMGMVDPSSGEFPAKMDIDYMRAYSRDPNVPAVKSESGYVASTTTPILIADRAPSKIIIGGKNAASWRSWSVAGSAKSASRTGGDKALISDARIVGTSVAKAATGFGAKLSQSESSGVAVSGVGAGFEFHVTTGDAPRALRLVVGARNARAGLRVVNSEGDVVATDDQDADTPTLIYTLSVPAGETYDVSWTQASPTGDLALFGAELDNQADTTGISAGKYVIRPKSVTSGSLEPQDDTVLVDDHESSWTVTPVSGHLFTIRSVEHPSEFLAYSPGRGNGLALRDAASGSSQLWQIEINLDSSFKITPASNPAEALTCADGPGGRAISFAKTTDKTESQEWAMIEAKSAAR